MIFQRSSGILLHPTSLPGKYGVGDLGEWAYRFVDYLEDAGQKLWQVLPLGPTSYGDSPYSALSAFAGNPLLISFDILVGNGWLKEEDFADMPKFSEHQVRYGEVIRYHDKILSLAFERFEADPDPGPRSRFVVWCAENAFWLEDFVMFAALKDIHGGRPWTSWPEGEALREEKALEAARQEHGHRIAEHRFRQWVFFDQWCDLKEYANERGIRLVGDLPIFVAHDSSDVWANRDLFYLDAKGHPTVIAGVPPDYFSKTGQRWGNPLYRWNVMKEHGYKWWIDRFSAMLTMVDIMRIDHFRGFEAYWEVPASEETAIKGRWVPGPDADLFAAVLAALGELPIIAEDLGVITTGVKKLRDNLGLPGMRVLQFAFDAPCGDNPFLPHQHDENTVVYTGTHDNNTTVGWWNSDEVNDQIRECITDYVGHNITEPHWELIRLGMMSVGHTFIVPMQDILGYGADTRMNTPGKSGGNWAWRFTPEELENSPKERLATMTETYSRGVEKPKKRK